MFYRYNALSNSFKACTQLQATLPQGLRGVSAVLPVKYEYKPTVPTENSSTLSVRHSSSVSGTTPKVLYKRWQDVPDELIPKSSKRDPNNTVYSHPNYIKFRKQQIFFQQDNGVPLYLKGGLSDKVMLYSTIVLIVIPIAWFFYDFYLTNFA